MRLVLYHGLWVLDRIARWVLDRVAPADEVPYECITLSREGT